MTSRPVARVALVLVAAAAAVAPQVASAGSSTPGWMSYGAPAAALFSKDGASGWTLPSKDASLDITCARAVSSSYAHFHNDTFCVEMPTATNLYYDRTSVAGMANGLLDGKGPVLRAGGCTGDLSYHSFLQRTMS